MPPDKRSLVCSAIISESTTTARCHQSGATLCCFWLWPEHWIKWISWISQLFAVSHIIIRCLGATQGWEMLRYSKCSDLLIQCLAPEHRPMKLRVEPSHSSLHPSFSNGKTAGRCALQCLGTQDRSQQQKWVTESVLQYNKSPKMQFCCGTLLL